MEYDLDKIIKSANRELMFDCRFHSCEEPYQPDATEKKADANYIPDWRRPDIEVTRNDSSRERIVQEAEYFSENDPVPGVSESGFYKYDYDCEEYVKIRHPVIAWMPWPEPFKD